MNIYGSKGTLLANPVKEYMAVCANDACDCYEVIHWGRRLAVKSFRKYGWRKRKRGWICPKCAAQKKEHHDALG